MPAARLSKAATCCWAWVINVRSVATVVIAVFPCVPPDNIAAMRYGRKFFRRAWAMQLLRRRDPDRYNEIRPLSCRSDLAFWGYFWGYPINAKAFMGIKIIGLRFICFS
jgi:hypothetical protein